MYHIRWMPPVDIDATVIANARLSRDYSVLSLAALTFLVALGVHTTGWFRPAGVGRVDLATAVHRSLLKQRRRGPP